MDILVARLFLRMSRLRRLADRSDALSRPAPSGRKRTDRGLLIVIIAKVAPGQRDEDVLEAGMPGGQARELEAGLLQPIEQRRQRDVGFGHHAGHSALYADVGF